MRIVLFLALFSVAALCADAYDAAPEYAKFYKKALPLRTSPNLVLNDLLNVADRLLYRYGVNDTKQTWISKFTSRQLEAFAAQVRKQNLAQICADPDALAILNAKITMDQVFYLADGGRLLFSYEIKAADCKK